MTETMVRQKVSGWLTENLHSHEIVDSKAVKELFEKETGVKGEWHEYDRKQMARMINERGKGGTLNDDDSVRYVGALDIAEWCARKFLGSQYHHGKSGMGFAFRQCIEDLSKAGY